MEEAKSQFKVGDKLFMEHIDPFRRLINYEAIITRVKGPAVLYEVIKCSELGHNGKSYPLDPKFWTILKYPLTQLEKIIYVVPE